MVIKKSRTPPYIGIRSLPKGTPLAYPWATFLQGAGKIFGGDSYFWAKTSVILPHPIIFILPIYNTPYHAYEKSRVPRASLPHNSVLAGWDEWIWWLQTNENKVCKHWTLRQNSDQFLGHFRMRMGHIPMKYRWQSLKGGSNKIHAGYQVWDCAGHF